MLAVPHGVGASFSGCFAHLHCNDCKVIFVARLFLRQQLRRPPRTFSLVYRSHPEGREAGRSSRLPLPKIPSDLARAGGPDSVGSGESNDREAAEQPADPADAGPGQGDRLMGRVAQIQPVSDVGQVPWQQFVQADDRQCMSIACSARAPEPASRGRHPLGGRYRRAPCRQEPDQNAATEWPSAETHPAPGTSIGSCCTAASFKAKRVPQLDKARNVL